MLPELVEAYYSPNMGLITHLQYPVQREEEVDEEPGQTTSLHLWWSRHKNVRQRFKNDSSCYLSLSCRIQQSSTTASTQELCSQRRKRQWAQDFWTGLQVLNRHLLDETAAYGLVHVWPRLQYWQWCSIASYNRPTASQFIMQWFLITHIPWSVKPIPTKQL